jgi:predicted CXXCH cytochrome family protein
MASSATAEECGGSECHADKMEGKWVHGPVGARMCSICHTPTNERKHEFELVAEREELCFACHDTSRDMMLEDYVHTPVAEGACVQCHDPHASEHRYTLKGEAASLCFQCHDKTKFEGSLVHEPVGTGNCNVCHNPHGSPNPDQLRNEPVALCLGCHEEQGGAATARHPHPPVAQNCVACHQPHASTSSNLLDSPPPTLCANCHESTADVETVSHPHPPAASGACSGCHAVHGSEYPRLFTTAPEQLCFTCHGDLGDYVTNQSHRHGPVEQGDCNACHDPHGSENHRILRAYFPEEFYTPYEESKYAMCFECHNREIALDESTKTLTDFRDGERNLHFLHVNKDVKGRSCRACHQVHASDQMKHIRESVPYGTMDWELPVEFTKTNNGGSCIVGCHAPKEYSR